MQEYLSKICQVWIRYGAHLKCTIKIVAFWNGDRNHNRRLRVSVCTLQEELHGTLYSVKYKHQYLFSSPKIMDWERLREMHFYLHPFDTR